MQSLVINLKDASTRMTAMEQQLVRLGLPFERIEAVTSDEAAQTGSPAYWLTGERPLKDTEKACLLSHMAAWRSVVARNEPILILEDDAVLSSKVPQLLTALGSETQFEHLSLETRKRRKLLSKSKSMVTADLAAHRLLQDRSGAAAYVLWPAGARKLLEHVESHVGLADAVISLAHNMASYQIDPACALQMDRCEAYGIATTYTPRSAIDAGQPAGLAKTWQTKRRRIAVQVTMGLRQIFYIGRAVRREVAVNPADFKAG